MRVVDFVNHHTNINWRSVPLTITPSLIIHRKHNSKSFPHYKSRIFSLANDEGKTETDIPPAPSHENANSFLTGNAYLLLVSILWGSYTPALRTLFNLPGAPSPLVVAASRGLLQALLLGGAVAIGASLSQRNTNEVPPNVVMNDTVPPQTESIDWFGLSPVVAGALEIGAYNTAGTLLQTFGLSMSSATRSAFLVQATALWTPLLASAFGMAPSPLLWVSSFIALVSTLLVTVDQIESSSALTSIGMSTTTTTTLDQLISSVSLGDVATLGAALAYSLSTVRIPVYAQRVQPLQLAFGKSLALAATTSTALLIQIAASTSSSSHPSSSLSLVATATTDRVSGGGDGLLSSLSWLWPGCCMQPLAWGIIIWSAVGPGALSAYLHVKGQSLVSPTDAQVVFAAVPLWSALIAAVVLPGERLGPLAWVGGGGMLLAGLVAALDRTTSTTSTSSNSTSEGGKNDT